ncbi:hypothetical protein U1Q18_012830, partial [Sarracenia purpurea var. burkii]
MQIFVPFTLCNIQGRAAQVVLLTLLFFSLFPPKKGLPDWSNGPAVKNIGLDCETEVEFEDLDSKLINLPVYDESVDAISLFIKGICEKGKYNKASEINHFSHDHPLHFVDKQIDRFTMTVLFQLHLRTIRVDKHPHNLTFVQSHKAKGKRRVSGPPCDDCGKDFESYWAAFECVTCNFRIHYECAFASSSEDDCPSSSEDDCPSSSESVNSLLPVAAAFIAAVLSLACCAVVLVAAVLCSFCCSRFGSFSSLFWTVMSFPFHSAIDWYGHGSFVWWLVALVAVVLMHFQVRKMVCLKLFLFPAFPYAASIAVSVAAVCCSG